MSGKIVLVAVIALAIIFVIVAGCLLTGCGYAFRSDAENSFRNAQRANRKAAAAMRAATAQTPRGTGLSGDALRSALSGRTLAQRYERFPDGKAGEYVQYRYFLPDGRFLLMDNWIHVSSEPDEKDSWDVSADLLCLQSHRWFAGSRCYRVARGGRGELQFYLDRPGTEADGLLEYVFDEIRRGPPPAPR